MSTAETYAAAVVGVLRKHFPDLNDPTAAWIVAKAIERNARDPQASFEFIVDPRRACWRLKARSDDRTRVRVAYYPVIPPGSVAGNGLEQVVNAELRALEADR